MPKAKTSPTINRRRALLAPVAALAAGSALIPAGPAPAAVARGIEKAATAASPRIAQLAAAYFAAEREANVPGLAEDERDAWTIEADDAVVDLLGGSCSGLGDLILKAKVAREFMIQGGFAEPNLHPTERLVFAVVNQLASFDGRTA
jgi:hypothetical protein